MRHLNRAASVVAIVVAVLMTTIALAGQAVDQRTADAGWKRVRSLAAGSEVLIDLTTTAVPRRFVSADAEALTTLNLSLPGLSRRDGETLLKLAAANEPGLRTAIGGGSLTTEDVRVGPDGVFIRARRVADTAAVFERWRRDDIVGVQGPVHRPHGGLAAVGGFVLGSILGWLTVFAVDELGLPAATAAVALGSPIAGGILAYRAVDPRRKVIYQRATGR